MSALVLVDLQNDFMPGGALGVAGGDRVVPVANRLEERFETVLATQDWHPPNHGSFAASHPGRMPGERIELNGLEQILWPVHCVQGTPGAELAESVETGRIARYFFKGTDPTVDSYSAFFDNARRRSTGLAEFLREHHIDRVHLLGLTTDYCVKYSALDALSVGFDVTVVVDGCRGVELQPGDSDRALEELRVAGVHLVHSASL